MTDRVTFGDFLAAAHHHLEPAIHHGMPAETGGSPEEAVRSLLRVIDIMDRYLKDAGTAFQDVKPGGEAGLGIWPQTFVQARKALVNAAGYLYPYRHKPQPVPRPAPTPLALRLDAVATALTTGRDLLHTHAATGPDLDRRDRSEWAPVISSPAATRALLAEFGTLAHKIARHGTELALRPGPGAKGPVEVRRRLNAACQWLLAFSGATRTAYQSEPIPAERELLWAIPSTVLPPNRVPDPSDPLPALMQGVIRSAERVRHVSWLAAQEYSWFPGLTVTSLRWTAKAGFATSHHNDLLLRGLASQTTDAQIREQLLAAADAAGQARSGWETALRSLDEVTTDMQDYASPAAREARYLAWWSGRLAHAEPTWTPASGPGKAPRPAAELAARPEDIRAMIAAVHHASDALAHLAKADREQIRGGERAARFLMPTRFLPEEFDIPRPFGPAPTGRVERLHTAYREVSQANADATTTVGAAAETVRSHSRIISAANATRNAHRAAEPESATHQEGDWGSEVSAAPGPVERTLLDLGVTRADMLQRGADIDRASLKIILAASSEQSLERPRNVPMLNRSAGTAELANHILDGGDARSTALLRSPVSAEREALDAEP